MTSQRQSVIRRIVPITSRWTTKPRTKYESVTDPPSAFVNRFSKRNESGNSDLKTDGN
jgi:hypothetical protein